ncbi:uncharacterized protein BJX67DRAFT_376303 [Aspergillus lucknowensis]|uniref:Uncharacterized protein n=1 Tax=Aspergillus lucknowensis TaxID=176173 RepID=A0ABR4M7A8_9EURO
MPSIHSSGRCVPLCIPRQISPHRKVASDGAWHPERRNLGTAILKGLTSDEPLFTRYIACVQSTSSEQRLTSQFDGFSNLTVSIADNVKAVQDSNVIILALDPSIIETD